MKKFNKKLYAVNLINYQNGIDRKFSLDGKLWHQTVDRGIILPLRKTEIPTTNAIFEGGVCDESFNFIAGYKRRQNDQPFNLECVRSYTPNEEIIYVDDDVIWGGLLYDHFGHILTDSFARLWWIIKYQAYDKKIAFVKDRMPHENFFIFFEKLGIDRDNILVIDQPTQFKTVYVPDQAYYPYTGFYKEFALAYDKIRENVAKQIQSSYKKIYLSRTAYLKKDMFNEEFFEEFYRTQGFEIIYPEQHSIEQQIAFISGADEIVATIGTLSHLACFAKEGTKLTLLVRSRAHFNSVQEMINQAKQLDYSYVDVSCNFLPHNLGGSNKHIFYLAPNKNWYQFIKSEFSLSENNLSLYEYLDNNLSHIGSYIKAWQELYGQKNYFKYICNQTATTILDNIEQIFGSQTENYHPISSRLLNELSKETKLYKRVVNKTFTFSRINGQYARKMRLSEDGTIENIGNNGHDNEFYWQVQDNILIFKNRNDLISSRYPIVQEKNGMIEILGYYNSNPELLFKLVEIN